MAGSLTLWAGLACVLLGGLSLVKPFRFLGIRTRRGALALLLVGAAVSGAVLLWPVRARRSDGTLAIDRFMPEYDFHERHDIRVRATPEQSYRAIREVTPGEFRSLVNLMRIRSFPARLLGRAPRRPPGDKPIMNIATGSSFLYLADEPPREIVLGTVGRFWRISGSSVRVASVEEFQTLSDPSVARAVLNFAVRDEGGGWSRVTTETRIAALSPATRRRFAAYWRLIYPGSALIRVGWLAAVKRRAEAAR